MPNYTRMSRDELFVEVQVLNEELLEAEELVDGLNKQIKDLQERSERLETRLRCYGINCDVIDDLPLSR